MLAIFRKENKRLKTRFYSESQAFNKFEELETQLTEYKNENKRLTKEIKTL